MRTRFAWLLLLLAFVLTTMGARSAGPMYMPPSIRIPAGAGLGAASEAVRQALLRRGWSIDEVSFAEDGTTGKIDTTLYVRVHTVTLTLEFDKERVEIHYVSSTNMRYEERKGGPYIHPKYTQWIHNIEAGIKAEFVNLYE